MVLKFVLDENLRGPLWDVIQRHNLFGADPVDVVRVGDFIGLPLASKDPQILLWAEREGRILLSDDKRTMPQHLAEHLTTGHYSPGVMIPRLGFSFSQLIQFLVLAAYASEPMEWENKISFIP